MIKRQMYGRASFPLLRKRVLLATRGARYHHEIRGCVVSLGRRRVAAVQVGLLGWLRPCS